MAFQSANFPDQRTEHLVQILAGDEVWHVGLPCVALVLSVCPQGGINKVTAGSFRGLSGMGAWGWFRSLWRCHHGGCRLGESRRGTEVKQPLPRFLPSGRSPLGVSESHTCDVRGFLSKVRLTWVWTVCALDQGTVIKYSLEIGCICSGLCCLLHVPHPSCSTSLKPHC